LHIENYIKVTEEEKLAQKILSCFGNVEQLRSRLIDAILFEISF
jgi:pyrroline-5-carboxylate reductase